MLPLLLGSGLKVSNCGSQLLLLPALPPHHATFALATSPHSPADSQPCFVHHIPCCLNTSPYSRSSHVDVALLSFALLARDMSDQAFLQASSRGEVTKLAQLLDQNTSIHATDTVSLQFCKACPPLRISALGVLPAAHHSRLCDCMDFIYCCCINNAFVLLLPFLSSTCPRERADHSPYHSL